MKVVTTMNLGEDVRQQLLELVHTTPPARLMFPLRDLAREKLGQGYPREQLLEDFEYVRAELRDREEEAREDAVMDVMDFLYGWCSPHMRL
jgi:hypothetical protein